MFKLLIADDEAGSREWLAREIPWEENDICLVGPAIDGLEAWQLCQEEKPELILTDIRMPGMNGLELARSAIELNPHTRVLVISCYDEFVYAKTCLDIGVSGYILKPSPQEEILQAVLKERNLLIAKRADEEEARLIKSQLDTSIPILREHFLRDLLYGEIEEVNLSERLDFLKITINPEQSFLVLILEVENNTELYLNRDEKERQLIWFMMYELVQNNLSELGFAVRLDRGRVGAVILGPAGINADELKELTNRTVHSILDQARLRLPCALIVGIGGIVNDVTLIYHSFNQAKQALRFHSQFGVETIIHHSNCYPAEKQPQLFLTVDEEKLITCIETATSPTIIREILHKIFFEESLDSDSERITDWYNEIGWILTGILIKLSHRAGFSLREVLEREDYHLLKQGGLFGEPDDVIKWWETQFGAIGHAIHKSRCNSVKTSIRQVKEYVDQHLAEAVTLSKAANTVYMSPSYLSRLFREQTGESFSEYVTRRKMEEARHLLDEGKMKVYEIAEAVGFTDPAYFGRVFRQYFNVTPTDYRK